MRGKREVIGTPRVGSKVDALVPQRKYPTAEWIREKEEERYRSLRRLKWGMRGKGRKRV